MKLRNLIVIEAAAFTFPSGSEGAKMLADISSKIASVSDWDVSATARMELGGGSNHYDIIVTLKNDGQSITISIGTYDATGAPIAFWNGNKKTVGQIGAKLSIWKVTGSQKKLRAVTNSDPKKVVASIVKWAKANIGAALTESKKSAITQTKESGLDTYKFTANSTDYTVIAQKDGSFDVYSKRQALSGGPKLNVYRSLAELKKRSNAFDELVALISMGR